ncbi:4Fe-4S dicluster domain-containing protein [Desulfosarcina ovata]|uniref:Tetrathionate reductase subunit B n=1 Tax=Desulfosarcina ovata subsp. ovata TaxID=2752305 RepID=A0A5K8AH30_9BACT|nr:4Fe-4S dicluster domain-containing protein [Desulfosarcina ovata]BBO92003.1 tetrathionate reductase subunit B [Desulfosarcina ovata subsp. ovata]
METRRQFIKNGLILCLGSGGVLASQTVHAFPETGPARWGMIIDMTRCTGCQSCMVACKLQNRTVPGEFNTRIDEHEVGDGAHARIAFSASLCVHCSDAPCVEACGTGAAFIHPSGLVLTDWNRCDGNGACIDACPYGARFHDSRFGGRVDKCDLCIDRLDQGLAPACVENCSPGARIFGRFDRPEGEFARYLDIINPKRPATGRNTAVLFHGMAKEEQAS